MSRFGSPCHLLVILIAMEDFLESIVLKILVPRGTFISPWYLGSYLEFEVLVLLEAQVW